jgi:hypothetical protein
MDNQNKLQSQAQSLTLLNHYETQLKEAKPSETLPAMVSSALQSKEPSIGLMIRNGATDMVKLHVTEAIATYVSLLHNSRSISVESIVTMSDYFLEHQDVKHLKASELKTFFLMAFKRQKYGKLYGGFGYDTLLEWLNKFLEERMDAILDYRDKEHTQYTYYEKQRRTRSEGDAFGIGQIIQEQNEDKQNGATDQNGEA